MGGAYASTFEVLFEKVIQLVLFDWGQGVEFSAKYLSVGDKFNDVVPFLLSWEVVKGLFSKDIPELLVLHDDQLRPVETSL